MQLKHLSNKLLQIAVSSGWETMSRKKSSPTTCSVVPKNQDVFVRGQ